MGGFSSNLASTRVRVKRKQPKRATFYIYGYIFYITHVHLISYPKYSCNTEVNELCATKSCLLTEDRLRLG